MASNYEIPSWAGKPPTGLHLDVLKDGKLIQKLMVDEKKCYLFGRNSQLNDFCIDHSSCSRVHAALVYHKHLNRAFLVDLGSTHGTFIGKIRLEGNKPTQLPVDSTFHFGASTRAYVIRERPHTGARGLLDDLENTMDSKNRDLLGLPETEMELDNLTEFNTAQNRRITMLVLPQEADKMKGKRKIRITFNEEEEVINPEDIDPSVGRFRNMVSTTVIPKKRQHNSGPGLLGSLSHSDHSSVSPSKRHHPSLHHPSGSHSKMGLYEGLDPSNVFSSKLGLPLPNPAPDIEMAPPSVVMAPPPVPVPIESPIEDPDAPKKKKYAKEAWPGKKPTASLLG